MRTFYDHFPNEGPLNALNATECSKSLNTTECSGYLKKKNQLEYNEEMHREEQQE